MLTQVPSAHGGCRRDPRVSPNPRKSGGGGNQDEKTEAQSSNYVSEAWWPLVELAPGCRTAGPDGAQGALMALWALASHVPQHLPTAHLGELSEPGRPGTRSRGERPGSAIKGSETFS